MQIVNLFDAVNKYLQIALKSSTSVGMTAMRVFLGMIWFTSAAVSAPVSSLAFSAISQDCSAPLESPLTFSTLRAKITDCQIDSIDALLLFLPEVYRQRYTLVYASRSLQAATASQPRVITFGADASLTLAFSNVPGTPRYDTLETFEFDQSLARFTFREIEFSHTAKPVFSEDNPALCLRCHQADPRPNWNEYFVWSGVYGAEDDSFFNPKTDSPGPHNFPAERALYKTFDPTAGRFAVLKPFESHPATPKGFPAGLEDFGTQGRHNTVLTTLIARLNGQRIARILSSLPGVRPYRYLLLAAVTCANPANNPIAIDPSLGDLQDLATYVPSNLAFLFPKSIDSIYQTAKIVGKANVHTLIERNFENLKITQSENPRVQNEYTWPVTVPVPGAEREKDYGSSSVEGSPDSVEVEWVMQAFGQDMLGWSTEFLPPGQKSYAYAMISSQFGGSAKALWDRFLDTKVDADLYPMYQDAVQNGLDYNYVGFKDFKSACSLLREKSLLSLSVGHKQ